jgi:chemotaxis protein CheX
MPVHPLPASLDTSAASPLRHDLIATLDRGEAIHLDGSGVARVGQACLQVLAAAQACAVARGVGFRLDDPSDALRHMIALARLESVLAPNG